jgi:hypothetical protein
MSRAHGPEQDRKNRHYRAALVPTRRHHDDTNPISARHLHSRPALTMSLAASRAVLRQSTFAVRRAGVRNASSTSEAAGAVKEKASEASSKASEGLSKVTSSASSAASKVGSAASDAANATNARVGGAVGRVQGQWTRHGHRGRRDWGCVGYECKQEVAYGCLELNGIS